MLYKMFARYYAAKIVFFLTLTIDSDKKGRPETLRNDLR